MINEIQDLLNKYLHWLKDKTILRERNRWLGRDNHPVFRQA